VRILLDNIIDKIKEYNPQGSFDQIIKAYNFAERSHDGQLRNSGESFFIHPYNVALILADLNMDIATICAGLLHDVLEDTEVTFETIVSEFGEEIANMVEGVTKLKKLKYRTKQETQAENLRKMVIAMSKDVRVIIIKLADRLHNIRTLNYMPDAKKKEKALETLEIYAPIAHRLGISKIKWELEDLSLRYIDPEGYYELVDKVSKQRREREAYIKLVMDMLEKKLNEVEIENGISGRPKSFYSIYRKMVYQNKNFEQIFDLTAIRVLVDNVRDCYGALGIVHTLWKPIPGRFITSPFGVNTKTSSVKKSIFNDSINSLGSFRSFCHSNNCLSHDSLFSKSSLFSTPSLYFQCAAIPYSAVLCISHVLIWISNGSP